jgi:hypothetical protein
MQQTPDFIRAMYRMLGQPFDMPLEVIAKDMSTCNFASAPASGCCRSTAPAASRPRGSGARWSRTIRWWLSRERTGSTDDPKKWKTPFPADYWRHELLRTPGTTPTRSRGAGDLLQIDMGTSRRRWSSPSAAATPRRSCASGGVAGQDRRPAPSPFDDDARPGARAGRCRRRRPTPKPSRRSGGKRQPMTQCN